MPLTNYHLGISLLIGYLLRRRLNWPTLILSSIIIDFEPLIAMISGLNYPLHGPLHTFLASIPAGILIGFALYLVREQVTPYLADLALVDKKDPLKSFILAGVVGWASHVLLDSPLYYEMKPLYPLNFNPMFQPNFHQILFHVYLILFLIGVLAYPIHLYRSLRGESIAVAEISVGLVLVGLGAINILVNIICHAGFLLIVTGFFMLSRGLKRMMPHLRRRIFSSFMMLAVAASIIYLASPHMLGLTLEQHIRLSFSTILTGSYILSLVALAILWPVLKLLKRNLNDYPLSLSINLLVASLILAPLLIPLLIAALSYIIIVIKTPCKLRSLKRENIDPTYSLVI